MVPPFCEKDVEKYFCHFERVAASLKWPENVWSLLLQCVITGKAQEVYASLSIEDSADYTIVKAAILKAYELVPEAYRQRFRQYTKLSNQTYVEFAREKEILFDRWCASQKAESREQVRQLILIEEFKSCVPVALATYVNEQKVDTLYKAATLADDFVLTHKVTFKDVQKSRDNIPVDPPVVLPRKSFNVLAAPDHSQQFSIVVDASDVGAGAVLQQMGADDVEHPVCYFSKKFNTAQLKYSTIEKEALALVLAIQHFEVYLSSCYSILVYCDHNPLIFLNSMRNFNQRLMRWSLYLQPYDLDIKHVRGRDNVVADALSRIG
ncbi:uncharacterized protein LOC128028630 isoform X2 [Carassius gibelio]|nr:uncharacterized protein LOC128028630 isoform X1 [Carassius gibelio]XP_052471860.1 uncharacterized protein LOC128028630 isoform X2 [Carassius gibelio]